MKKLTNMTTHSFDLERFGNNAGLKGFLRRHSLDGLELMEIGEDEKQILQKEDVVGFHRLHYPCWYCFWKKDTRTPSGAGEVSEKRNHAGYRPSASYEYGVEDRRGCGEVFKRGSGAI